VRDASFERISGVPLEKVVAFVKLFAPREASASPLGPLRKKVPWDAMRSGRAQGLGRMPRCHGPSRSRVCRPDGTRPRRQIGPAFAKKVAGALAVSFCCEEAQRSKALGRQCFARKSPRFPTKRAVLSVAVPSMTL
jgi:hypothetical protein